MRLERPLFSKPQTISSKRRAGEDRVCKGQSLTWPRTSSLTIWVPRYVPHTPPPIFHRYPPYMTARTAPVGPSLCLRVLKAVGVEGTPTYAKPESPNRAWVWDCFTCWSMYGGNGLKFIQSRSHRRVLNMNMNTANACLPSLYVVIHTLTPNNRTSVILTDRRASRIKRPIRLGDLRGVVCSPSSTQGKTLNGSVKYISPHPQRGHLHLRSYFGQTAGERKSHPRAGQMGEL